jgi:hypothetical protein
MLALPVAVFLFAAVGFGARAGTAWFYLLFGLVPLMVWAVRSGWSPVELSSAVAEPGKLTRMVLGRTRVFSVADSVAVVMGTPAEWMPLLTPPRVKRQVWVIVTRRDGLRAPLRFDDADDAGLRDFVARWLAVEG